VLEAGKTDFMDYSEKTLSAEIAIKWKTSGNYSLN
jgi:hypothetical protein